MRLGNVESAFADADADAENVRGIYEIRQSFSRRMERHVPRRHEHPKLAEPVTACYVEGERGWRGKMRVHVDSAGNMRVPQAVRDTLGIPTGGEIEMNRDEKGRTYIERAKPLPTPKPESRLDGLDRIQGTLKTDKSTDEMMEFLRGDR